MSKHYLSSSSKVVSLRSRLPKRRPSAGSKPPTLPVDPLWAEDTIAAMARCITSAPGEMEAQREQLALVQGLTRARTCYLLQKTELSNQLEVVAVRGRNDPRIAAAAPGEGVAGKAFSDGRIVRADGTVAVPLFGAGTAVGFLGLFFPHAGAQSPLASALASRIFSHSV